MTIGANHRMRVGMLAAASAAGRTGVRRCCDAINSHGAVWISSLHCVQQLAGGADADFAKQNAPEPNCADALQ